MENTSYQDKTTRTILLWSGLLLFAYTTLRAVLLAFTWDEAYTFTEYVNTPYWYYTHFDTMSANNHLLNTWLMKLSLGTFGIHEFTLRLPNLLAHALYLFFSAKLVLHLGQRWTIIASFILLNTNPFLLDFFCAARGYGLAMGLLMVSVYYFLLFLLRRKPLHSLIATTVSVLAVLAQFTMLYYMFSMLTLMFFIVIVEWIWKQSITKALFIFIISIPLPIILFFWFSPLFIHLQRAGAFYYGGDNGFVQDTVLTLAKASWYEMPYSFYFTDPLIILVTLIYAAACVFSLMEIFGSKKHSSGPFLLMTTGLLTACIFWIQYLHFTIGVKYPLDRTGLFFIPLFLLLCIALFDRIRETWKRTWPVMAVAAGCVLHLCISFNLHYLLMWKVDSDVKEVVNRVREDRQDGRSSTIAVEYMFEPGMNFYKTKYRLDWLRVAPDHAEADYYMLTDEAAAKVPNIKGMLYFPYNGVGLYRQVR